MTAARRWLLRRKHFFTRDQLDNPHWPHPRPAHDPRLVAGYFAIMGSSLLQVILGVSPTSPQAANGFDARTVFAFATLAVVASLLILYAAYCTSQYWSFVTEAIGCAAMVVTFCIYLSAIRAIPDYWATFGAWWSLAIVGGHGVRAFIIVRRFW